MASTRAFLSIVRRTSSRSVSKFNQVRVEKRFIAIQDHHLVARFESALLARANSGAQKAQGDGSDLFLWAQEHRPKVMPSGQQGTRLAAVLFAAAKRLNALDQVGSDLATVADLLAKDKALVDALFNPSATREETQSDLQAVAKAAKSPTTQAFLEFLGDSKLLKVLPVVITDYAAMMSAEKNEIQVSITTARPLTNKEVDELKKELKKNHLESHEQLILEQRVDEGLVGGRVLHIGETEYDESLRSQIAMIETEMQSKLDAKLQEFNSTLPQTDGVKDTSLEQIFHERDHSFLDVSRFS